MIVRSLVAALGFITVLSTLTIVGVLMVKSLGASLGGGLGGDTPSGGAANSVVLRISGTPGVQFSGNYTTPQGSQDISGTLGTAPTDYNLGGPWRRGSRGDERPHSQRPETRNLRYLEGRDLE